MKRCWKTHFYGTFLFFVFFWTTSLYFFNLWPNANDLTCIHFYSQYQHTILWEADITYLHSLSWNHLKGKGSRYFYWSVEGLDFLSWDTHILQFCNCCMFHRLNPTSHMTAFKSISLSGWQNSFSSFNPTLISFHFINSHTERSQSVSPDHVLNLVFSAFIGQHWGSHTVPRWPLMTLDSGWKSEIKHSSYEHCVRKIDTRTPNV